MAARCEFPLAAGFCDARARRRCATCQKAFCSVHLRGAERGPSGTCQLCYEAEARRATAGRRGLVEMANAQQKALTAFLVDLPPLLERARVPKITVHYHTVRRGRDQYIPFTAWDAGVFMARVSQPGSGGSRMLSREFRWAYRSEPVPEGNHAYPSPGLVHLWPEEGGLVVRNGSDVRYNPGEMLDHLRRLVGLRSSDPWRRMRT